MQAKLLWRPSTHNIGKREGGAPGWYELKMNDGPWVEIYFTDFRWSVSLFTKMGGKVEEYNG